MKINPEEALNKLSEQNDNFLKLFERGTISVEIYKPIKVDVQTPHSYDELYIIISGSGQFINGTTKTTFAPGDFFFVPAGVEHRFEQFTEDFSTWVIFFGPDGGVAN